MRVEEMDVDKFGSPPSYQRFRSLLRPCAQNAFFLRRRFFFVHTQLAGGLFLTGPLEGQNAGWDSPEPTEMTATIRIQETTARGLHQNFPSFLRGSTRTRPNPQILALQKQTLKLFPRW